MQLRAGGCVGQPRWRVRTLKSACRHRRHGEGTRTQLAAAGAKPLARGRAHETREPCPRHGFNASVLARRGEESDCSVCRMRADFRALCVHSSRCVFAVRRDGLRFTPSQRAAACLPPSRRVSRARRRTRRAQRPPSRAASAARLRSPRCRPRHLQCAPLASQPLLRMQSKVQSVATRAFTQELFREVFVHGRAFVERHEVPRAAVVRGVELQPVAAAAAERPDLHNGKTGVS
jgi:hypothetical protein